MNAPVPMLDTAEMLSNVSRAWDDDLVQQLSDYIEIPAKSPSFDANWAKNGYLETVLQRAATWVEQQKVAGLQAEIIRLPGRTPILFFDVAATRPQTPTSQTVLMYGHLDKQPEFDGWRSGLGPWTPKYLDGKLYGRGSADDGYATYAAITAIQALKAQKVAHPRIVGIIETCEESGSPDLRDSFVIGAGSSYLVNAGGGFASSGVMTSAGSNPPFYYALAYIMKT